MGQEYSSETDKLVGGFFIGCAFMFVISLICLLLLTTVEDKPEIRTNKKITPEWVLTTDGKKIDTVYIYKTR